jgi:hypothetical protein
VTGRADPSARAAERGDENSVVGSIVATLLQHLSQEHPPWRRPALRDAHPKHHLLVEAEFVVDEHVPDVFRHGVLARPGTRFRAWIRFSSALKVRHDLTRDARGMAVKLLGVEGERPAPDDGGRTQDFLAVTHHAFFASTAADFVDFPAAVSTSSSLLRTMRVAGYFFSVRPLRLRWRGLVALQRSMIFTSSPLLCRYFSQTPYRLGPDLQVKFSLLPRRRSTLRDRVRLAGRVLVYHLSRLVPRLAVKRWRDCLRDDVIAHLAERDAWFDFAVQVRKEGMPLDDAVMPWDERQSPFVKVATIRIPARKLTAREVEALLECAEQLSYTPWHTLSAHLPLGSINEARRAVYDAICDHRHRLNGTPRREPREGESPGDYRAGVFSSRRSAS